jgi:hypothetical protein
MPVGNHQFIDPRVMPLRSKVCELLRRSRKLAAYHQHHNPAPEGQESFKKEYRRLVRRYNAMLKAGTLSNRTLRNDIRATLVDMAHQLRRAGRNNPENGP